MVLSKDNVAKNIGKTSPTIITKIHNMPWLKQATAAKDSDCHKAVDVKMSNMKANDQTTSEKKNKKQNGKNKNKKKSNADASKNNDNNSGRKPNVCKEEQSTASSLIQKNVWSGKENGAKVLFPNSSKDLRDLSEEEQIQFVLEMSKETARLESLALNSPEEIEQPTDRSDPDEVDIWVGVHKNLPSPKNETLDEDFDTNNNAEANKSQISSISAKKIENKVASSDESIITKNEPANQTEKIEIKPLDVPPTPPIVPKFIDCLGRIEGRSEKHLYMGKGGRMKEEQYLKQLQQQKASNGSQQQYRLGFGPPTLYPPRGAPPPMSHNQGSTKGSNDRKIGPPPRPFSQDSQRQKNLHVTQDNSHDENQAGAKQWDDKNRQNFHSQDSQRPKNLHVAEKNSLKGNQACAKQSNDRNRQSINPQNSQHPKNLYGAENNSQNENQRRGEQWNDRNRQGLPFQDSQRVKYPSYSSDANARYDSSQRRSGMHAQPNRKPHQSAPYDPSNNPFKFQRDLNSRNTMTSDKGDSQKLREVPHNKDDLSNTMANRGSEEIPKTPLTTTKNEDPSSVVTSAQKPVEQGNCSEIEVHVEASKKMESDMLHQKSQEFSEDSKSHLRLSDFNSRHNVPFEQASLPIDSNPSCSSAISFVNVPSHSFENFERPNAHDVCETRKTQIHPAMFAKPPPGFEGSESFIHAARTATYVVPIETSLGCSSSAMTAQTSTESLQAIKPEVDHVIPIPKADLYARLKITDPMLYEVLVQKEQLDRVRNDTPMVSDDLKEIPMAQNSSQNSHSLADSPMSQQQCNQTELLNPNAEQLMQTSAQARAAMTQPEPMPYYSREANYNPPSMPHQHQCIRLPQEMPNQDNPMWNSSSSNMHYNMEQLSQQQHVNADVNEGTPMAILGRQNHPVSEKNYLCQNAQPAMHIPQLNDDYHRYQSSGFENIPMFWQRQVPYRLPLPQCGVASNQFCSIRCAASHGSQNQVSTSNCVGCSNPMESQFQTYEDFVCLFPEMALAGLVSRQINDGRYHPISSQGCKESETNSIKPSECYVLPMITKGLPNNNHASRGRGRINNQNSKK